MKKAVIDRIIDREHAVLLIGEEEQEHVVSLSQIPDEATEGTWLNIMEDGSIKIDEDTTQTAKQNVKNKLYLLRKRSSKSNFKK